MNTVTKAPADSVYLQLERQLVRHDYYFLRTDPRARVLIVHAPKDSSIVQAHVVDMHDSSDARFSALGAQNDIQAMTAVMTVVSDATLERNAPAPAPAAPTGAAPGLRAGSWTYSANIQQKDVFQGVGPRTVAVARTSSAGVNAWLVTAAMRFGPDPFSDSVWMRATDLSPLARHAIAGQPPKVAYAFTAAVHDTLLAGTLATDGDSAPISVPLAAHAFLNYYSLRAALAAAPLTSTWSGDVSALELGKQAAFFALKLQVSGEERIENPAGLFDCWIVHVTGPGIDDNVLGEQERAIHRARS